MPHTPDLVRKEFDHLKTHRDNLVHALLRLPPTPEGTDLLEPHWSPAIPDLQHSPDLQTLVYYRRLEGVNITARLDHLNGLIIALLRLLGRHLGIVPPEGSLARRSRDFSRRDAKHSAPPFALAILLFVRRRVGANPRGRRV